MVYRLTENYRVLSLAEEVGGEDEEDHQEGEDEKGDLQPLVDLATEGDGVETLALEAGGVVFVVVMTMSGVWSVEGGGRSFFH